MYFGTGTSRFNCRTNRNQMGILTSDNDSRLLSIDHTERFIEKLRLYNSLSQPEQVKY
jgi:hypothetical protein